MIGKATLIKCSVLFGLMIVTLALCRIFPNAATDPQTGMVLALPEEMEGYQVDQIEPGKLELKWLPEDTGILKRLYRPKNANSPYEWIHATLIMSGNDPRSLHRPEVCLDGQGWTITARTPVDLEVNGTPLTVMDYQLERNEKDKDGKLMHVMTHYIYWWIGKNRSTHLDWKRILYTDLDNMFRNVNNRWGYPSVMVQVDPALPDRAAAHKAAQERAYDFVRSYAPMFQKSLGAKEPE